MGNFNGLQQPPYNTSLMGVVKGALDHYGIDARPAEAFVLSGHAFVVNIHEELCASAPYCWNSTRFFELLGNLGLGVRQLGMALPNAPDSEKAALEATVREALARGSVCSLLNLDNQLILGHDADGFRLAQPWGDVESTPARLSYGSWREFQAGPPLTFFEFRRQGEASVDGSAVFDALDFALAIWREPQRFAEAGYGMGPDAYANWIAAIDAGHGDDHGNWWNGMVWAECREQAGDYFQSLAAAEFRAPSTSSRRVCSRSAIATPPSSCTAPRTRRPTRQPSAVSFWKPATPKRTALPEWRNCAPSSREVDGVCGIWRRRCSARAEPAAKTPRVLIFRDA